MVLICIGETMAAGACLNYARLIYAHRFTPVVTPKLMSAVLPVLKLSTISFEMRSL